MKNIKYANRIVSVIFPMKIMLLSLFFTIPILSGFGEEISNKGKIIFSSDDKLLKEVSLELSEENFDLLDDLYLRVFLIKPLSYYYDKFNYDYDFHSDRYTYNYAFRIFIDGKEYTKLIDETSEEGFKKVQTMAFPLSTGENVKKRKYSGVINHWVDIVEDITPGKHEVEIQLVPYTIELVGNELPVLASGKFTLEIKDGEMPDFIAKAELDLPEPTMVNPQVEDEIVDASKGIIRRAEPVKALITDVTEDWNYTYDENGNILYRHIVASVVYTLTDSKGCFVNSAIYTQKHQGYGDFGPMTYSKSTEGYYDYEIPCDVALSNEETASTLDVR